MKRGRRSHGARRRFAGRSVANGDRVGKSGTRRLWAVLLLALLAALSVALAPAAHAQSQDYSFTKVADSAADGFDPNSFGCASINDPGDIAFRAGRLAPDGFNTTDGIYRANAGGGITTIVEDAKRYDFLGRNPSMNDLGQVSFAARLASGDEAILRGDGKRLTTIATTKKEFNFFGFDTSVNNAAWSPSRPSSMTSTRGCSRVAAAR